MKRKGRKIAVVGDKTARKIVFLCNNSLFHFFTKYLFSGTFIQPDFRMIADSFWSGKMSLLHGFIRDDPSVLAICYQLASKLKYIMIHDIVRI